MPRAAQDCILIEPDDDLLDVIASSMNTALLGAVGGDPDVRFLDAFGLLDDVVANPSTFGLSNVTDACAQFISCVLQNTSSGIEYSRLRTRTRSSRMPS